MNEMEIYELFIKQFKKVYILKKPTSTYEDRLYAAAHGLFMDACERIESMYSYLSDYDDDGTKWYDFIREEMILKYCDLIDR